VGAAREESMHKFKQGISLVALLAVPLIGTAQDGGDEFDRLLTDIDDLSAYNAILERQIATQNRRMAELQAAIGEVPEFERKIPPLIERMVDGLEEFIGLDIPFLEDDRANGLANLRATVENAGINDAEKLRRVLEAWEIENEYGRSFSSYESTLEIDGVMREVDMLRVGRVALLYQTQDLEQVGAWDSRTHQFVALGTEHRNSIRQAIRMAQNTTAPVLVLLPIKPPEQ
jgi:Protein of unknown function (DUF3450)